MPERTEGLPTTFAKATQKLQDELVPRVAKLTRPVLGNEPVSKDERRRRWWQEEDGWTPEHEHMLLTGLNPDGTPALDANGQPRKPMTREDVGLLRFKWREIDARAAGNGDDDRLIAKYAQEMTALGPPDPDPLEQGAMAMGAPETATLASPASQTAQSSADGVPETGGY